MIRPPNPTAAADPPVAFDCYISCHRRRAAGQRRYVAPSIQAARRELSIKIPGRLQFGPRRPRVWLKLLPITFALALHLASPGYAALVSGVYQTVPGATVREWGDSVPNGSRIVPLFATLRFDLDTAPSFSAVITNAVLEGGDPLVLTVRSLSGSRLADGTHTFHGDYLREIYPSGTQYFFDYQFSTSTNGAVLWNGMDYWAGGHLWYVTVSNITIVPVPWLDIARVGTASVQISWLTNFADHVLEFTTSFPAGWGTVTNLPVIAGERVSVTLDTDLSNRFYRLRKP